MKNKNKKIIIIIIIVLLFLTVVYLLFKNNINESFYDSSSNNLTTTSPPNTTLTPTTLSKKVCPEGSSLQSGSNNICISNTTNCVYGKIGPDGICTDKSRDNTTGPFCTEVESVQNRKTKFTIENNKCIDYKSFKKKCPDGYILQPDNKKCNKDKSCPSTKYTIEKDDTCTIPFRGYCPQGHKRIDNKCSIKKGCLEGDSIIDNKCSNDIKCPDGYSEKNESICEIDNCPDISNCSGMRYCYKEDIIKGKKINGLCDYGKPKCWYGMDVIDNKCVNVLKCPVGFSLNDKNQCIKYLS